jgi:hypothetical protein
MVASYRIGTVAVVDGLAPPSTVCVTLDAVPVATKREEKIVRFATLPVARAWTQPAARAKRALMHAPIASHVASVAISDRRAADRSASSSAKWLA